MRSDFEGGTEHNRLVAILFLPTNLDRGKMQEDAKMKEEERTANRNTLSSTLPCASNQTFAKYATTQRRKGETQQAGARLKEARIKIQPFVDPTSDQRTVRFCISNGPMSCPSAWGSRRSSRAEQSRRIRWIIIANRRCWSRRRCLEATSC